MKVSHEERLKYKELAVEFRFGLDTWFRTWSVYCRPTFSQLEDNPAAYEEFRKGYIHEENSHRIRKRMGAWEGSSWCLPQISDGGAEAERSYSKLEKRLKRVILRCAGNDSLLRFLSSVEKLLCFYMEVRRYLSVVSFLFWTSSPDSLRKKYWCLTLMKCWEILFRALMRIVSRYPLPINLHSTVF